MLGHVAGGGNLVGGRCVRKQSAARVPDQFLAGEPTQSLDEAAFDLADVYAWIDAAAYVVQDVHSQYTALARERVDRHFAARGTVGKVVERPPGDVRPVPVDLGC